MSRNRTYNCLQVLIVDDLIRISKSLPTYHGINTVRETVRRLCLYFLSMTDRSFLFCFIFWGLLVFLFCGVGFCDKEDNIRSNFTGY